MNRVMMALLTSFVFAFPALAQSAPVASLIATPFEGAAPLLVEFNGAGSYTPGGTTITGWHWEFGDGAESFDATTTDHTYTTAGSFEMTLTITNSASQTDSITGTIVVSAAGAIFAFPPIPSPTPVPTSTAVIVPTQELPTRNIIDSLATVDANLIGLPANLSNPGQPLLPADQGYQVFRYAKWIVSANVADEVFGPFGPIIFLFSLVVRLLMGVALVYFISFIVRLLLRFVVWIVTNILKFIPFFG